jgi:hypothetical protein
MGSKLIASESNNIFRDIFKSIEEQTYRIINSKNSGVKRIAQSRFRNNAREKGKIRLEFYIWWVDCFTKL